MDVKLGFLANTELFLPEIFCYIYYYIRILRHSGIVYSD